MASADRAAPPPCVGVNPQPVSKTRRERHGGSREQDASSRGHPRTFGARDATANAPDGSLEGTLARLRLKELKIARNKRRCIMFRPMITRVGVPAVLGAVLLMAAPACAQHHGGGGHGGGFRGGSPHIGGFHPGGFHRGGFHSGGL